MTTRNIKLDGISFAVNTPWKVGDMLTTLADAYAINQQRIENIGHLCRVKVKEMTHDDAEAFIAKTDKGYVFTRTEEGKSKDPVTAKMALVAGAWAKAELVAAGLVHDLKAIKVKAIEVMIEREDQVRARAVKMVASEAALLAEPMPDEDLDDIGETETE